MQYLATDSRISSAVLVHAKGRGFSFHWATQVRMHLEPRRHLGIEVTQERPELLGPVALVQLLVDPTRADVEGREQAGGAVAGVVVGGPLRGRGQHRQG